MSGPDRLSAALNHPAGRLVEAVLEVLKVRRLKRDQGLPEDVRDCLEKAVAADGEAGRLGRVIICSRLTYFFDIDAVWTIAYVVPLLDWSRPAEAVGAWEGFLWPAIVRPTLWPHVKPHFMEACTHVEELSSGKEHLAGMLASVSLDLADALSEEDSRACLRGLGDGGRGVVGKWLVGRLEAAEDAAPELWKQRIGPWIARTWPRDRAHLGPMASVALASAAVESRDALPEAVRVIGDLLVTASDLWSLLHRIGKSSFVAQFPEAILGVLSRVVPDIPSPADGYELKEVVDRLSRVGPTVTNDQRYQRLWGMVLGRT